MWLRKVSVPALLVALTSLATTVHAVTFADTKRVNPTSAPWVVSMWLVNNNGDRLQDGFLCTGSLINSSTVVTAAHCFYDDAGKFVGLNEPFVLVRNQDDRTSRGEVLVPRAVRVHKFFEYKSLFNDIALIDLKFPTASNKFLQLPTKSISDAILKKEMRLFGWGLTEDQKLPKYLRSTKQFNANKAAASVYGDNFWKVNQIAAYRKISSSRYSAACSGDSGGPLTGKLSGKTYLMGIVSFGSSDTCRSKNPVVYTRVAAYRNWISNSLTFFADARLSTQFDVSQARFSGDSSNPLLSALITNLDSSTSRSTDLGFGTRRFTDPRADLAAVTVITNQVPQAGWDVELKLQPKSSFLDGCEWAEGNLNNITVNLKVVNGWYTEFQVRHVNRFNLCLGPEPIPMAITSPNNTPIPAGCEAGLRWNSDGSISVLLQRECSSNPSDFQFRINYGYRTEADLEPGWDSWAGPVNLTQTG